MAEDVIIRGELIEYLGNKKCKACESRDRDCIMRKGAENCLLCSDNGRSCIFERDVRLRGRANLFSWAILLGEERLIESEVGHFDEFAW